MKIMILEYDEITIFLLATNNFIFIMKANIVYWRASKQSTSQKMIPTKQCATKSLRKGHGIDLGDYGRPY